MLVEGDYLLTLAIEDDAGCPAVSLQKVVTIKPPWVALPPLCLNPVIPLKGHYERVFQFSSDLFFEQGDAELLPDVLGVLDEAIDIVLRDHPNRFMLIVGHTDNVPWLPGAKFRTNHQLSLARAEAMRVYIMNKGIPHQYLMMVGYGPSMPIGDNSSLEGRALNRRMELLVYRTRRDGVADMLAESNYFLKRNDHQSALVRLIMAAKLDPTDASLYRTMGDCYLKLGNEELAYRCLKHALELDPNDQELRRRLESWSH